MEKVSLSNSEVNKKEDIHYKLVYHGIDNISTNDIIYYIVGCYQSNAHGILPDTRQTGESFMT